MKEEKKERLKAIDSLFRQGKPVSFKDCEREVERLFKEKGWSFYTNYASVFRNDTGIIRKIISDHKIDPEMLIIKGPNKKRTYQYKDPQFSIAVFIDSLYSEKEYNLIIKALKEPLEQLKKDLPCNIYEQVKFILQSHIEDEYNPKDKKIDYDELYKKQVNERLPILYDCINKTVIALTYKTEDNKEISLILHPYYLKQREGAWFLFGYNPDTKEKDFCVPVFDIINITLKKNMPLIPRPTSYFDRYEFYEKVEYKDLYFITIPKKVSNQNGNPTSLSKADNKEI